jgi:hypothetical protein
MQQKEVSAKLLYLFSLGKSQRLQKQSPANVKDGNELETACITLPCQY